LVAALAALALGSGQLDRRCQVEQLDSGEKRSERE
jgi:hypothetical protein